LTPIALFIVCLFTVTISRPAPAAGQGLFELPLLHGCAWPFISDVASLNAFYPDTNATYWVAPYVSLPGTALSLEGTYPEARFMSLNTYDRLGASISAIADKDIDTDAGSTNPFRDAPAQKAGPQRRFNVTIVPPPPSPSPNTIVGPPLGPPDFDLAALGYVIYRVYVPNDPNKPDGGEPLPNITVVRDGEPIQTVEPCKETDSAVKLIMFTLLEQRASEFAEGDLSPNQNNSEHPRGVVLSPVQGDRRRLSQCV
jgi:hypothetical protein